MAETPYYLLKEFSYLEQGQAEELASSAGWCISLVSRASGQAGVPWAWLALSPVCALNKDVFLHYSLCSASEKTNSGRSCNFWS